MYVYTYPAYLAQYLHMAGYTYWGRGGGIVRTVLQSQYFALFRPAYILEVGIVRTVSESQYFA